MTEHALPGGPSPAQAVPRPGRVLRLRERSLMRNPLPAIAAAITVFLVVLTLMVARLASGGDPALHALASAPATVATTVGGHSRRVLRTTASGRTVLTTEGVGGEANTAAGTPASTLVTRASGAVRRDD